MRFLLLPPLQLYDVLVLLQPINLILQIENIEMQVFILILEILDIWRQALFFDEFF